ncbi:hypothetical protein [Synechococcus sp. UW179B]|uniref:hypothetical protein n=1 Tax=Synechococcus sp. UW179B TaxID=2575516 RepID=UPI000E0FD471|nr:hypothetical protein [Synechococcus sp. UW179B]
MPAEWWAQRVCKALIAKADHVDIDRTDRLASKAEKYGIKAIRLLAQSTRFGVEQKQRGKRWSRTGPASLRKGSGSIAEHRVA